MRLSSFHIYNVRNGDIDISIDDIGYCAGKYNYDVPNSLLKALADLLEKKETEIDIDWSYDVHEYSLTLRRVDDTLYLNRAIGDRPINDCDDILDAAKAVLWEFELYEDGNGRKRYEKQYRSFPQQEYDRLKQLVKLSKNK